MPITPAGGHPGTPVPATPLLTGLGIRGYRSFGHSEMQYLAPLAKINVLAGPNGSGKSNVLRLLTDALASFAEARPFSLEDRDRPMTPDRRGANVSLQIAVAVPLTKSVSEAVGLLGGPIDFRTLQRVLGGASFRGPRVRRKLRGHAPSVWLEFEATPTGWKSTRRQLEDLARAASSIGGDLLGSMSVRYTQKRHNAAARVLDHLAVALGCRALQPPLYVDLSRQSAKGAGAFELRAFHPDHGLPKLLRDMKNPDVDEPEKLDRFAAIQGLLREFLGDPAASIETPVGGGTIVTLGGRRAALEDHATAVRQLLMLAALAGSHDGRLMFVEEPENHLHPRVQRRLLSYLSDSTTNQYLMATHSPHLLDSASASITEVEMRDGWSRLRHAAAPQDVADVAFTLGIRASDLVQANSVVWVEGPSDRVYIGHWIRSLDPSLVEGVHYSIMFYGGSLLAHLAAHKQAAPDLVALPFLNRHFALVVDSDRRGPREALSQSKSALIDGFAGQEQRHPLWVTAGYTIENYVRPELLAAALADLPGDRELDWDGSLYAPPLENTRLTGGNASKVKLAEAVRARSGSDPGWNPLAAAHGVANVHAIINMIRTANDMPQKLLAAPEPPTG